MHDSVLNQGVLASERSTHISSCTVHSWIQRVEVTINPLSIFHFPFFPLLPTQQDYGTYPERVVWVVLKLVSSWPKRQVGKKRPCHSIERSSWVPLKKRLSWISRYSKLSLMSDKKAATLTQQFTPPQNAFHATSNFGLVKHSFNWLAFARRATDK